MTGLQDNLCRFLAWDSNFFGFKIAQLSIDLLKPEYVAQIDDWCHRNGISCLYFLADFNSPESIEIAEQNNFHLVDVRIEMELKINKSHSLEYQYENLVLRDFKRDDMSFLQDIAKNSFTSSRFYFDKRFPRNLCDSFYATWIKVSCEGYAQKVLVAELGKKVVGFITCHLEEDNGIGRIGLLGLSSEMRGKSIGQIIIHQASDWFLSKKAKLVRIVTQGRNVAAQRLYQKCGFITKSVYLWYHKWYKE